MEIPENENTLSLWKISLDNFNSITDVAKERSVNMKTLQQKIFKEQVEGETDKHTHTQKLSHLWDNIKQSNIHIIGIQEEKEAKSIDGKIKKYLQK